MAIIRTAALLASCAIIAWLTTDLRLAYVPQGAPAYNVSPIQGMQLADYFTPYGGLPPADGTSICATGTSSSICSPVTATLTLSNATPQILNFGGTSCTGTLQCVGTWTTTNAGATQFKVDTAASTVGFIYSQGNGTGGDTLGTCTGTTSEFQVNKDNNSNFTVKCNGNTTIQGSTPISFQTTGTAEVDSNSTGATIPFELVSTNASAPTGDWFDVCYTSGGGSCTTKKLSVLTGGAVQAAPTINASTVVTTLMPLLTTAGGLAAGATAHCVQGSAGSVALSSSAAITLSNGAVFTSATSYTVATSFGDSTAPAATKASSAGVQSDGSHFTVFNLDATNAHTIVYLACGT